MRKSNEFGERYFYTRVKREKSNLEHSKFNSSKCLFIFLTRKRSKFFSGKKFKKKKSRSLHRRSSNPRNP